MQQFQEHLPGVVNLMVWGLILSQSTCSLLFFVFQHISLNLYKKKWELINSYIMIMIIIIIIIIMLTIIIILE